jgi:hypothetical protein
LATLSGGALFLDLSGLLLQLADAFLLLPKFQDLSRGIEGVRYVWRIDL